MKKYLIVISLIFSISLSVNVHSAGVPDIGYREFKLGMQRIVAEKIVRDKYLNEYAVNFNAVAKKDKNIIEIKDKNIQNKYIFLYFNEKNNLYDIIVWAAYMDNIKYTVLVNQLVDKYKTPYSKRLDTGGYHHLGWVWDNKKYIIQCFYEADIETVFITYSNNYLKEKYHKYLYGDGLEDF